MLTNHSNQTYVGQIINQSQLSNSCNKILRISHRITVRLLKKVGNLRNMRQKLQR